MPDSVTDGGATAAIGEAGGTDGERGREPGAEETPAHSLNKMPCNSFAISVTLPKRSAGSFCTARENQASNPGGTFAWAEGSSGCVVQILTIKSPSASLSNGARPVTHSNATTPSDQMSVR